MGLNVGNLPVTAVYVGSTPVTAVYVGAEKVWPTREMVQITLGTSYQARDQLRAALTARGLDYWDVTEIPFDIELVGTGSVRGMFESYTSLTSVPDLDTSQVTDMDSMFYYCSSLTHAPAMDTSSVTNMEGMFESCSALTYVPDMDTSSVTNMEGMFYGCSSLTTAPAMNTAQVTNMDYMFESCSALTHVPDMDTAQVTTVSYMFYGCSSLTDGNVRLIGRNPAVTTTDMITGSGLTREPFFDAAGNPIIPEEVYQVSLTDVRGNGTVHPLLSVTVPAGQVWDVQIEGTVTRASAVGSAQPRFRIGSSTSGSYAMYASVNFSGTVSSTNATIAMVTNSSASYTTFTGTVTIRK